LQTNEELMEDYKKGNAQAFTLLFERISNRTYAYVARKINRAQDVEDICQSIFMKLHQTKERYSNQYPFDAWLFTICRSVVFDHLRKVSKIEYIEFKDFMQESEETIESVDINLTQLNSKSQDVIKLKYYEDLDFDEIAFKLNTSSANIRQILSRSLRFLKKEKEVKYEK
jgi:RNA polymerase sigma-70 factor (ECF subfamily)